MQTRLRIDEGWSTLILLWVMLLVSASAVVQADLIDGLQVVPMVATVSLFVGLFLAKSRFPSNTAHLFSLVYGLFALFLFVGILLPEDATWRERVFDIVNRQAVWFTKAFEGGTSRDGLIFIIHTSAIFWLLGYTASWYTFHTPRVWRVIVPTGLVLLSVVYYYTGPKRLPLYLAFYALLALVYLSRTHLIQQEKTWRETAVRYDRSIWMPFLQAGFLAGLIALIVAWFLPTMTASATVGDALTNAGGPWREFQDNWTRLFASLRSYGTNTVDPYDDTLVLGGPRTVEDTPIMDVYVPQKLANVYWQAVVYDSYENGIWDAAEDTSSVLHFPDDGYLPIPRTSARQVVTQTVINYLPNSSTLYAAPEVIGSDRQMFVEATQDPQENLLVSGIRSRYVLRQGDRYQVTSRLSTADAQSLRNASTNYPGWVQERYLQMSDSITPETIALAAELTNPYDNPFDKAIVVRDYLREAIKYNDQIDAPPDGMDAVHYALFVLQEGYCNYYASAMAMMLRSQGIPTRVVSGYAQGDYNQDTYSYRVRASNAHTWVEVFFPQYGWIQFEPTAAIPVNSRPETSSEGGDAFESLDRGPQEDVDNLENDDIEQGLEEDAGLVDEEGAISSDDPTGGLSVFEDFPVWQVLGASLVLMVAGAFLYAGNELNQRVEADITRSYTRLGNWARWLGVTVRSIHTPYERAEMLTAVVPEGSTPIRNLTKQFVLQRFSRERRGEEGFDSIKEWRSLRPILLRQTLQNRLQRRPKRGKQKKS